MSAHTKGPWRWEYNPRHKSVQLCGGSPKYDKTVMDFVRVGMSGAGPRFIDNSEGFNLLGRLVDRVKDWCRPEKGREHHADWFQEVVHPDAVLIAAAPELLHALEELVDCYDDIGGPDGTYARITAQAALAKAKGLE